MNDLNRMRQLAGVREWDDEGEDEFDGSQSLWLLQVSVRHEGTYFAGIYSSRELAWDASERLDLNNDESVNVTQVTLDAEPETLY